MHGGACGVQWTDNTSKAKKGYCIAIANLHPDGQNKAKAKSNEAILCFACAEKISKLIDKSNNLDLMK